MTRKKTEPSEAEKFEITCRILERIMEIPAVSFKRLKRELHLKESRLREALDYLEGAGIISYERMWQRGRWIINRDYLIDDD